VSDGHPLNPTKLLAVRDGRVLLRDILMRSRDHTTQVNASSVQFGFSIFILAMVIIGGSVDRGAVHRRPSSRLHQQLAGSQTVPQQPALVLRFPFQLTRVEFSGSSVLLLITMVLRPQGCYPTSTATVTHCEIPAEYAQLGNEPSGTA